MIIIITKARTKTNPSHAPPLWRKGSADYVAKTTVESCDGQKMLTRCTKHDKATSKNRDEQRLSKTWKKQLLRTVTGREFWRRGGKAGRDVQSHERLALRTMTGTDFLKAMATATDRKL